MNLWVLKTVLDKDKTNKVIDSYGDSLTEYYNYDNLVANSKRINSEDYAIIIDKKRILGFAKIENIDQYSGTKIMRKCPECGSSSIEQRKKKTPMYRCNYKHEFNLPLEEEKTVMKYSASFSRFIPIGQYNDSLVQLRPFYVNNYNGNMSMQLLAFKALGLFKGIKELLDTKKNVAVTPTISYTDDHENPYFVDGSDERETVLMAIKARRGQQSFRKSLLEIYHSTCVITGCKIVDILEAAHINPFRGEKDNHQSNGILLRADVHTLFDLNLIGIDPESFKVIISDKLKDSEYEQYDQKCLKHYKHLISIDALKAKNVLAKE
ncbi:HNH endonuclease [Myroides odoratimimus]|uniref:HNH endonuclease n=1 Tax=Myroides odoratimimus TaxID=76832 RepID=UPI0025788F9B|nr:HNH endonuclease [Myroides odoratimimus]MDM1086394.1 HNH endonuclease [Myroides odoratimimus]